MAETTTPLTAENAEFKSTKLIGHAIKLDTDRKTVLEKREIYLVEHTYDTEKTPMAEKMQHWDLVGVMREKANIPKNAFCYTGSSDCHAFFDIVTKYAGEWKVIRLKR